MAFAPNAMLLVVARRLASRPVFRHLYTSSIWNVLLWRGERAASVGGHVRLTGSDTVLHPTMRSSRLNGHRAVAESLTPDRLDADP